MLPASSPSAAELQLLLDLPSSEVTMHNTFTTDLKSSDLLPDVHNNTSTQRNGLHPTFSLQMKQSRIDIRDSQSILSVYREIDAVAMSLCRDSISSCTVSKQELNMMNFMFIEERCKYFAERCDIDSHLITEQRSSEINSKLNLQTTEMPPFFNHIHDIVAQILKDPNLDSYFRQCCHIFIDKLVLCITNLTLLTENAWFLTVAHQAGLADVRNVFNFSTSGLRENAATQLKALTRTWALSSYSSLMRWNDKFVLFHTTLKSHAMQLYRFCQGRLNIFQFYESRNLWQIEQQRGNEENLKTDQVLCEHATRWRNILKQASELIANIDQRTCETEFSSPMIDACRLALDSMKLEEATDFSADAFLSMRLSLKDGECMSKQFRILYTTIATEVSSQQSIVGKYKADITVLHDEFNTQTLNQAKTVEAMQSQMSILRRESEYHCDSVSRSQPISDDRISLNMLLLNKIHDLSAPLEHEKATHRELSRNWYIMRELYSSCADVLPHIDLPSLTHHEIKLSKDLTLLATMIQEEFANMHQKEEARRLRTMERELDFFTEQFQNLNSSRDNILHNDIALTFLQLLRTHIPSLKQLKEHINQLCIRNQMWNCSTRIAAFDVDVTFTQFFVLKLNFIVSYHMLCYLKSVDQNNVAEMTHLSST